MYTIALEQRQYQTYVLSDQEANSRVEVVPERGGIVTSWQVDGREMFYMDTERFTHPDLTVRGGIPILFPICGGLPNNTYTHNGQEYTLKQHGFARNLPWQVTGQSTQDGAGLTVTLESNDETRAGYPFDFQVDFTYILKGDQLEILQKYTNRSQESMPFSTGLHPYFAVTDKTQLRFNIPATELIDHRTLSHHSFAESFDFEQDEIDVAFPDLTAHSASVGDGALELKVYYDTTYSVLVFWTVKGKPFYCLEPWTSLRNAMITGDRLVSLPPGETLTTTVRLTAGMR
ncbi:aldose epimerase [Leptolyngbya sp. 'hensonii']|uniref:aldose epimerase family protein n=1 Tax=Leptolyngbya sp. 'hensonii' TaxID=1922337 RepID=UPI00094FC9E7|nr:aldose epimerase [Leptolyngbya sp. 'hensonii']OLP19718.1 aldose epimerase [Leptolyngbya sp. 'hensonii']